MQHAGQQYGQGGAATSSHPTAPFGHNTEQSPNHNGSITSSLRQFRKDKQPLGDNNNTVSESHVARVAPHNHYPPNRSNDCYRYPTSQYQDYNLPSQVKYSEVSGHQQLQEPPTSIPSVIHKAKGGKEYMELGNIQTQIKQQQFSDHLNVQQNFNDPNLHGQFVPKEAQIHPAYKSESQYFSKDQFAHQMPPHNLQKYNMPPQVTKYPTSNDFLSKLERINPTMARSIMSDHHLQESPTPPYRGIDHQNRMYQTPPQNRRYPNYSHQSSMQVNHYSSSHHAQHGYPPPHMTHQQAYQNYPNASCNYQRSSGGPPQMGGSAGAPRFPLMHPHDRSISPRRGYSDNVGMNYGAVQQKMSPNYGHHHQYNAPEYAQHYQHRRLPIPPSQDYYPQQACRSAQYLPHQMVAQEVSESRLTVSDNLKQYIENWAEEETTTEMQIENGPMIKENLRVREDQPNEPAVYMINASELQYLENGIPLVADLPLVASENGQYVLKNGVSIDNTSGMVRIVNKGGQMQMIDGNSEDRVVNLHIMDQLKPPDCMMASKSTSLPTQRPTGSLYEMDNKSRVVVHQNTVIQTSYVSNATKDCEQAEGQKVGNSLPMITDEETVNTATSFEEEFSRSIIKESKRETVDKNCSPINLSEIQDYKDVFPTVICPTKSLEASNDFDSTDSALKNMPSIEELCEDALKSSEFNHKDSESENNSQVDVGKSAIHKKKLADEPGTLALGDSLDSIKCLQEHVERSISPVSKLKKNSDSLDQLDKVSKGDHASAEKEDKSEKLTDNKEHVDEYKSDTIDHESTEKSQSENDSYSLGVDLSMRKNIINVDNESCSVKRSRRFFSVDDIINHIGNNNYQKQKTEDDLRRRHSLQSTKDFLQTEIQYSFEFDYKEFKTKKFNPSLNKKVSESFQLDERKIDVLQDHNGNSKSEKLMPEKVNDSKEDAYLFNEVTLQDDSTLKKTELLIANINDAKDLASIDYSIENNGDKVENASGNDVTTNLNRENQVLNNIQDDPSNKSESKIVEELVLNDEQHIESAIEDNKELSDLPDDPLDLETNSNFSLDVSEQKNDASSQNGISQHNGESRATIEIGEEITESIPPNKVESKAEIANVESNEVLYRNVIRVEESSILLQIAGELVEINVNNVNGKKLITVVSLSNSTVVDLNDNYESAENNNERDPLKIDEHNIIDFNEQSNEIVTDPQFVEPTSEIIIGMDLSLEEEIQLDLEQPKVLCTKAAKKAYEYDLQIPSITTSDDVYDNNKNNIYLTNDKVSSSRIEHSDKIKKNSKKTSTSKKMSEKVKKTKKLRRKSTDRDDDFVLFSDLVKARKLKKMKLKQQKIKENNMRADSTIILDESVAELETPITLNSKETKNNSSVENIQQTIDQNNEKEKSSSIIVNSPIHEKEAVEILENKLDEEITEKVEKGKEDIDGKPQERDIELKLPDKVAEKSPSFNNILKLSEQTSCGSEKVKLDSSDDSKPNPNEITDVKSSPTTGTQLKTNSVEKKRKLSLEEYNNRKKRLLSQDKKEPELNKDTEEAKNKIDSNTKLSELVELRLPRPERIKFPRPKSLDEVGQQPVKENTSKRKFSLEETLQPRSFDWEETQSPKIHQSENRKFSEFRGLINETKAKANNTFQPKEKSVSQSTTTETSEDQILQSYKVQVESKLNNLNLKIPRKPFVLQSPPPVVASSSPSSIGLIQRFLRDEKLSPDEMEKIRKIIAYKRVAQQLKSPPMSTTVPDSYEVTRDQDIKLHLKKLPGSSNSKKKKKRFRNLYSGSTSDSEDDLKTKRQSGSDYSVVQSNCLAGVVPKLIIKRKPDFPVPVVRLERLDLGVLINKKPKYTD